MSEITLRAGEPSDAAAITELFNEPEVRRGTLRLPYTPLAGVEGWLKSFNSNKRMIVAEIESKVIGFIVLERLEGREAHVGEVFIAVHDGFHRRGVGRALMAAALEMADNWMGLTRVQLDVLCDNAGAIALYEQSGFEHEGRARAATLREGKLVDHFYMGRLRAAPERLATDQEAAP